MSGWERHGYTSEGYTPTSHYAAYVVALALFILLLTGCAGPTVLSTPNSCSSLLPASWVDGVPGAELPSGDTVADWIAFGDAQTGKLDVANGRTRDAIEIVSRCETRDAKAVRSSTKGFFGRLFS